MATKTRNQRRRMNRRNGRRRAAQRKRRKMLAAYANRPTMRIRGQSSQRPASKMPENLQSLFPHWDPNAEPVARRLPKAGRMLYLR